MSNQYNFDHARRMAGRHKREAHRFNEKGRTTISIQLADRYPEDIQAMEFLNRGLAQGFTTRQIITDAILYRNGHKPEMYQRYESDLTGYIKEVLQPMFDEQKEGLVTEIIRYLRENLSTGQLTLPQQDATPEDVSNWEVGFAQAFLKARGQ